MATSSKTPIAARLLQSTGHDRYFYLLLFAVLASLYLFGIRDHYSVSGCHRYAESQAKEKLIMRVKADPDNKTLIQAAQAGLFANEDYQPIFRNCMLSKGYK